MHHGNGSQDIFSHREGILYISTHQSPLYPGTGSIRESISNNILNVPLPASTNHDQYLEIFDSKILPTINQFNPELVLVSAGFDAHQQDPLANLSFTEATYQAIGERLAKVANTFCQGRLISILEGGYNLNVIGPSVLAYLQGIHQLYSPIEDSDK